MDPEPPLPLAYVYEELIAGCPVLHFADCWDFVPPNGDCRGAVSDPPGTLAALRARWSEPTLEAARVIQRLPDGELRLHPALYHPKTVLVALRRSPVMPPFELLTAAGCLSGQTLPLLASLRDSVTHGRRQKRHTLFAVSQIGDVALLHALGLPVTLSAGLTAASLEQLRELEELHVPVEQRILTDFSEPDISAEDNLARGSGASAYG